MLILQWVYCFILGAEGIWRGSAERSVASEGGNLKMKSRSRYSLRGVHGHFCEAMVADPWTFCAPTALRLGSCSLGVGRRLSRKPPRPELECERVPKESCSSDKPQGRGRGRVPGWTRCTCSASRASWPSSPGSSLALAFCASSCPRPLPFGLAARAVGPKGVRRHCAGRHLSPPLLT